MANELRDLAEQVYDQHGFTEQGVKCLAQQIGESTGHLAEACRWAADNLLRERSRAVRDQISNGGMKVYTDEQQERIGQARGFFARPMPIKGLVLGQATKEDLMT